MTDISNHEALRKLERVEADIQTLYKKCGSLNDRIEREEENRKEEVRELKKVYDTIYNMGINIALLVEQMEGTNKELVKVRDEVTNIKDDLDELKYKPLKEYDKYKMAIGTAILTGIIAFILGLILAG